MASFPPLRNVVGEEFEQPIAPNSEGVTANGFFPQNATSNDEVAGMLRDSSGNLILKDGVSGTFTFAQVLAGGSGISETTHKTLLQLIHFIDEGPAEGFTTGATKTTTGTVFPTQNLWRRADTTKLVEQNITWVSAKPTVIEWKMYAANGSTVLATVTDAVSYSGPFETSRVRTIV